MEMKNDTQNEAVVEEPEHVKKKMATQNTPNEASKREKVLIVFR